MLCYIIQSNNSKPYFNSYAVKKISDVPYEDLVDSAITSLPWSSPQVEDTDQDWYIEESRIRGGYNNTSTDKTAIFIGTNGSANEPFIQLRRADGSIAINIDAETGGDSITLGFTDK